MRVKNGNHSIIFLSKTMSYTFVGLIACCFAYTVGMRFMRSFLVCL